MDKLLVKEIEGHRYGLLGNIMLDCVPESFSDEWLDSCPDADTLILCSTDPYPGSVLAFTDRHPEGKVYAANYTAFMLKGIIGDGFTCESIRDNRTVGRAEVSVISQSGKGSRLEVRADGQIWPVPEEKANAPVYEKPTVAICYVSGCSYLQKIAGLMADGIRESGDLDVVFIDLAARKAFEAVDAMINAGGILIGTTTEDGDAPRAVRQLLAEMSGPSFAGIKAAAFGSYTASNEGVSIVNQRMRQLGMDISGEGISIQYAPDEDALRSICDFGYDFGCRVLNIPNIHKSKLVKCLVCGEIFDASLGICPVCGVGMDKCVPVEDEVITLKVDTDREYVIIGGGAAGIGAATAIRNRDKTGHITIISAEDTLPINRPMLTKNMAVAARVKDSILIKEPEWFEENNIRFCQGCTVTSIDPSGRKLLLDDGKEMAYDRLVYAAGAECFIPGIRGADLKGVISVRHLDDLEKIWELLPGAKNAVVIGGGVLGLEAAAELMKMRLKVTVLEMAPQIMGRQIDEEAAAAIESAAAECNITIRTGVSIAEIKEAETKTSVEGTEGARTGRAGGQTGRASGVALDDGTVFPADIVIMSCGVRASVEPLKSAGAECGRAVIVSKRMETSLPHIYAAGDCAEFGGTNFQLWAEASEQGRIAGANAVGDPAEYVPVPMGASFEGMKTALYAVGDVGKGGVEYKIVQTRNEIEGSYRKYWFKDGRITGGILFGNTDRIGMVDSAVGAGSTFYSIKDQL